MHLESLPEMKIERKPLNKAFFQFYWSRFGNRHNAEPVLDEETFRLDQFSCAETAEM